MVLLNLNFDVNVWQLIENDKTLVPAKRLNETKIFFATSTGLNLTPL